MVERSKINITVELKKVLLPIEKALEGTLPLDSLYDQWPESLANHEVYEKIYDHVEAAVEHYPGHVLFAQEDAESYFRKSIEYKNLLEDKQLVEVLVSDSCGEEE